MARKLGLMAAVCGSLVALSAASADAAVIRVGGTVALAGPYGAAVVRRPYVGGAVVAPVVAPVVTRTVVVPPVVVTPVVPAPVIVAPMSVVYRPAAVCCY